MPKCGRVAACSASSSSGRPTPGNPTLLNALTGSGQTDAPAYPFCTIEPNVGVVEMGDERLDEVSRLFDSPRSVPSAVEFVEIAGPMTGATHRRGAGRFLGHIREVDAIVYVVHCFEPDALPRAEGVGRPRRPRADGRRPSWRWPTWTPSSGTRTPSRQGSA